MNFLLAFWLFWNPCGEYVDGQPVVDERIEYQIALQDPRGRTNSVFVHGRAWATNEQAWVGLAPGPWLIAARVRILYDETLGGEWGFGGWSEWAEFVHPVTKETRLKLCWEP